MSSDETHRSHRAGTEKLGWQDCERVQEGVPRKIGLTKVPSSPLPYVRVYAYNIYIYIWNTMIQYVFLRLRGPGAAKRLRVSNS